MELAKRKSSFRRNKGGRVPQKKWGPALLPAPTAPSEGSAGVRNLVKNPKAPTRSRSWLTSSGVASDRTALSEEKPDFYWTALPEGSLVFRCPASSRTEVLAQNRPTFRGPSWVDPSRVPLRSPSSEKPGSRVALEKEDSSGASSRLAPDRTRKFFPLPAGGDRFF